MQILFQTAALQVAPVADGDLPAILEVYKQCEDFLSLGPVPEASMHMVKGDIAQSQKEHGQYCVIRNKQGVIVGVLDFIANTGEKGTGFLSLLMIAAPWRNRGYGRAVVGALEDYLRTMYGVEHMQSAVQTNNANAIRFWERLGYCLVRRPEPQPDGTIVYHTSKEL